MSHALKREDRIYAPPRDKSKIASPRAAMSENCNHSEQVKSAFVIGFSRYEKAMEELAKV